MLVNNKENKKENKKVYIFYNLTECFDIITTYNPKIFFLSSFFKGLLNPIIPKFTPPQSRGRTIHPARYRTARGLSIYTQFLYVPVSPSQGVFFRLPVVFFLLKTGYKSYADKKDSPRIVAEWRECQKDSKEKIPSSDERRTTFGNFLERYLRVIRAAAEYISIGELEL